MQGNIHLNRRSVIRGGARVAAALAMPAFLLKTRPAVAQAATPLGFQLSWLKSIQYGGYFAGVENGTFKKYGVDATFAPGGPNIDAVANVASGNLALGDRPMGPLLLAREKGLPVKIIGTVFQKSPFSVMSLETKPIRTIQDLRGKTVAVAPSARPTMTNLLKDNGIDPQSVNMVPAAPDPFALVGGQIDAYTGLSTNQGVMLEMRGIKIVTLNLYDLGLKETSGNIYGREDFLKSNRDLVVRFLKGAVESWRWALANPEQTAKLTVENYGSTGLDYNVQLAELKASAPYIEAGVAKTKGLLAVDSAAYGATIELYRKVDLIKTNMKAEDICDPSYINEALTG